VGVVSDAYACDVGVVDLDLCVGVCGDISIDKDERSRGFGVVSVMGARV